MNQRGYMLISVVFLTLIVSFIAAMALQTMTRAKNSDAALRLHAINLANEQFALIESGSTKNIPAEDLKSYGLYRKDAEKIPTEFHVTKSISGSGNLREVKVTVTWNENKLDFEKIIWLNE